MNKTTQYNQQAEPKQRKSDVEEICIYQNLEVIITASISENKWQVSS